MRSAQRPYVSIPFLLSLLLLASLSASIATGQTEITLHEFTGGVDGSLPFGGLTSDGQGNYFGVTNGEDGTFGTIFELSATGGGDWNLTTLYTFQGGLDGNAPTATLVRDASGNLYGATTTGGNGTSSACNTGTGQFGCGTVFELSPDGNGGWQKTTLYQFQGIVGRVGDGLFPSGPLVLDSAGNLYGTTALGGGGPCAQQGCGTVFELSPSAGGWTETIIAKFRGGSGGDAGAAPEAGVIFDAAGNLYGTTINGGSNNAACLPEGCGTVFKMTPKNGGGWSVIPLFTFRGGNGAFPASPLVIDRTGALYGVARGGSANGGVVYKLAPSSGEWNETVLVQFKGPNGSLPSGPLVFDENGNLYGATGYGGTDKLCFGAIRGCGLIFKLSPSTSGSSSGSWTETILYRFAGEADGTYPNAPLIFDSRGNLYGVASTGGSFGFGTVFEIAAQ